MERVASNYNFSNMENLLFALGEDHSSSKLNILKNEINKFFTKTKCKEILYTMNTDKLFFGMRVYPKISGTEAVEMLGSRKPKIVDYYYLEFDSKLFDPMLNLTPDELTAILLHEIGHIVYDTETIDEVKRQIDIYFAQTDDYLDLDTTKSYQELLAYGIKDSIIKTGSIFSKIGHNDEIIADSFVIACGYGASLQSAMTKISRSSTYLNQDVDDRFIALAWVLRLKKEFSIRRVPAVKTLNKAKELSASQLEKRELGYAAMIVGKMDAPYQEAAFDNVKARFSDRFKKWQTKGVRYLKDDIYELNLKVRCAESEEDLMYVIRTANNDIAIIQDYMHEDIPDAEREELYKVLEELYDVRQKAAKHKDVGASDSMLKIYYPNIN